MDGRFKRLTPITHNDGCRMMVGTSVWGDFFNQHPSPQAQRLTIAIQQNESIAITGLIYTEILLGLRALL